MAALAFLTLLLFCSTQAKTLTESDYSSGKWYKGDGTYYGGGIGQVNGGNCAYRGPHPKYFKDYTPVAMNDAQYMGFCGACLEVKGSGKGLGANPIRGPFRAIVTDRCPECKLGDIDLAKDGDGRWEVEWKVIPCDVKSDGITFQFEGSNKYYHKLQPRGLQSPARKVVIDGVKAYFSQDNHWIAQKGSGFSKPTKIEVTTVLGKTVVAWVNSFKDGVVKPSKVKGGKAPPGKDDDKESKESKDKKKKDDDRKKEAAKREADRKKKDAAKKKADKQKKDDAKKKADRRKKEAAKNRADKKKKEAAKNRADKKKKAAAKKKKGKCVPMWKHCRGKRNKWGTRRCCGGGLCRRRNQIGWKCVSRGFWAKRCVPKGKVCKGWRNKWGTQKCCGGHVCRKSGKYHRCVRPPKCRRKYAKCGHWSKWRRRNGRLMGGRRCCQRGSRCKWVRRGHFACIPW